MKAFALIGAANAIQLTTDRRHSLAQTREYPQPDIRGANPINAHPDSTFSSFNHNDWTNDWRTFGFPSKNDGPGASLAQQQSAEYPQPDIRGANPINAHPDSTFSSFNHNDWTNDWRTFGFPSKNDGPGASLAQQQSGEYPQPDIRGANPINAHPDSTFSSFNHNDWTNDWRTFNFPSGNDGPGASLAQQQNKEYPQPDIRGANPINAHPDSTFSSFNHNDWTNDWRDYNFVGTDTQEYPQPDIRGANPGNSHSDSTFSSHLHNDWTNDWVNYEHRLRNYRDDNDFALNFDNKMVQTEAMSTEYPQPDIRGANPKNAHSDITFSSHLHNDWTNDWVNYEHRLRNYRDDNDFALNFDNTGF